MVKIEYEGRFEDGTVFDSSEKHGKPLEFEIGKKQVIPGFENAVKDMKKGEEKEITIKPEDGYGEIREELVKEVPRSQLPPGPELKEGMMLMVSLPNGQQIPAKIVGLAKETVKIDLNHPLAGKTLNFRLKKIE
jgi:FKBP-type peptidyl-prolyl cis-trans isomerase 2